MFTHNSQQLRKCVYANITHISHDYAIILRRYYANKLRNHYAFYAVITQIIYADFTQIIYAIHYADYAIKLRKYIYAITHNFIKQFTQIRIFITQKFGFQQVYAMGNNTIKFLSLSCQPD